MTTIDWVVLAIYLAGILAVGFMAGRRGRGTLEFLLGGRRIPTWAAAISILASEISAATFIGTPGFAYVRDCTYLQFAFGTLAARILIAWLLIDIYYRLGVFTVYGFLSERFDDGTRTAAAAVFLIARLLASGVRLFIGSLPLALTLKIDIGLAIAIMGTAAMLYTVWGGIKAVIWTDVVQVAIYMTGALGTIAIILWLIARDVPGGLPAAFSALAAHDKARVFNLDRFGFDNAYHVISAVIGGLALTMATHGTDQDMVQRMLTCRTSREGRMSAITSGIIDFPIVIIFLAVGLALWAFYHLVPVAYEVPAKDDKVFIVFVQNHMPPGLRGLVVAGICAAVMGSLSTAINAMATTSTIDFWKRLVRKNASDGELLAVSRAGTVLWSVLLMGVAWVSAVIYARKPDATLIAMALGVMTLVYGALLGVFLLAIFTRERGNAVSNTAGMALSVAVIAWLGESSGLAWPWFIVIGTVVTFAVGALGRSPARWALPDAGATTEPGRERNLNDS